MRIKDAGLGWNCLTKVVIVALHTKAVLTQHKSQITFLALTANIVAILQLAYFPNVGEIPSFEPAFQSDFGHLLHFWTPILRVVTGSVEMDCEIKSSQR